MSISSRLPPPRSPAKPSARVNAHHDAERGELGFLGARQHSDIAIEDALGLGDEVGAVFGLARRRRGDGLDLGDAELVDQGAKAAKRPQRPLDRIGAELAGGGERAARDRTAPSR